MAGPLQRLDAAGAAGFETAASATLVGEMMITSLRAAASVGTVALALLGGTSLAAEDQVHVHTDPAKLKWGDAPITLKGAKIAVLHGDPGKPGPFAFRLQLPNGFKIPAHWHSKNEAVTVISGTFKVRAGENAGGARAMSAEASQKKQAGEVQSMKTGAFIFMPAKVPHSAEAEGETIVQVQGEGPFDLNFVDPADDPRKKQ